MQTAIYKTQALGINGVISKAESQYLATIQGVLMQDTKIGTAVLMGENQGELVVIENRATQTPEDEFLGFVVRDGFINSCETPNETYKQGDTVTVITKGSVFLTKPEGTNPKAGQWLLFSKADGTFDFQDTKGSTSGDFTTAWRVASVDGDIIEATTQF